MGLLKIISYNCMLVATVMTVLQLATSGAVVVEEEVGTPLPEVCEMPRGDRTVPKEVLENCTDAVAPFRFFFHSTKHCKKFTPQCQAVATYLDPLNVGDVPTLNYFNTRLECEQACTNVVRCRHEPLYRIEDGYPILPTPEYDSETGDMLEYGFGTIASFQCNDGFRLVNGTTRMCQLDGTWSESQPHCAMQCSQPELLGNDIISITPSKNYYNVGDQIQLDCMDGLEGSTMWTCSTDADWIGTLPTCTPTCSPPPVDNAHPPTQERDGIITHYSYTCHDGFYPLYNHSKISCTNGTLERPTPICTRVVITPPNTSYVTFENGTYNIEEGTENVIFRCHLKGLEQNQLPRDWLEGSGSAEPSLLTDLNVITVEWMLWRKPTGEEPPNVDANGNTLTFQTAFSAQAGVYTCNICDLSSSMNVNIIEPVEGRPNIDFFSPTGLIKQPRGSATMIRSLTSGRQPLTVVWKHNGLTINTTTQTQYELMELRDTEAETTYSTLTIQNVDEIEEGSYNIMAYNNEGRVSSQTTELMLEEDAQRFRRSSQYCDDSQKVVMVGVVRRIGRTKSNLESIRLKVDKVLRGDAHGITHHHKVDVRIFSDADTKSLLRGQRVVVSGVALNRDLVYIVDTPIVNYSLELENEIATC